ncbi:MULTISPECIES: rhodanese-like domain-containing protein [unclassified Sporolactobacillus]|uniref:rhodanese-like domain-containing protein n=1 Tax=unclassified Sporolactobacillus TaxID=2628533 RepID=UPI002367D5C5|nr:rhodanese-like domain-containing protein [Sporolactobacillus sp. CQH2019]MDD9150257.1 rhodanese-like domain-containing protein [Sporolactobacillus sp. CQH2019]
MPDWVISIILGLIIVWLIFKRTGPIKGVRNITTEELRRELKNKGKQFIDVRTPAEYKGNHIREFRNVPLNQLPQKLDQFSKDKEIVVICQSGMRSARASKILKRNGFEKITNVKGGMNAW